MEENKLSEEKKSQSTWKKWIWRSLLLIILLPILIVLLLQIPVVQNWSVDQLTSYFSKKMKTEVSIDHIDFSIWNGLELDKFYLADGQGDTLVYAERLDVGLMENLFSIVNKEIYLNDISLTNGHIHIRKRKGDSATNIESLVNSLMSDSDSQSSDSKPYLLRLNTVTLNNIHYEMIDENKGMVQSYDIQQGSVDFDKIDLEEGIIDINRIYLNRPNISISRSDQEEYIIVGNDTLEIVNPSLDADVDTSLFTLSVGDIEIANGTFKRVDERSARIDTYKNSLDPSDMDISSLYLRMSNLYYTSDNTINANINQLSLSDKRGFNIKELSADTLSIDSEGIKFVDLVLETDLTRVENDFEITYNEFADFKNLSNRVFFKSNFNRAKIGLGDLTYFIKELNNNEFFRNNKNRQIILDGNYYGRINKLSGRDVKLYLDDGLQLEGSFDSRNITDPQNALVNIKVERLSTDINFLENVIPGFTTPENFEKLGKFSFAGRFDGYFRDFVAYGALKSDLGVANLDMRLDVKDGVKAAKYSGEISLADFDLKKWTDDNNFGSVNFTSKVSNGSGFTLENAFADLSAKVQSFDFKGYTYGDFILDGNLRKNNFDGTFKIEDENADFEFDGFIELVEGRPYLDFVADVNALNLEKLNLSNEQLNIGGRFDVNMNGKNIDDLVGDLVASDLRIMRNDSLYQLDTISFSSTSTIAGQQRLEIYSDIVTATIDGQYQYKSIVNSVRKIIKENYPFYTSKWSEVGSINTQDFDFDLHVIDSKNIFALVGLEKLVIKDLRAKGRISNNKNEIALTSSMPFVAYDQYQIFGGQLNLNSIDSDGSIFMTLDSSMVSQRSFNPININAVMSGDSINFNLQIDEIIDSLERLDIVAQITPHDKGLNIHLEDNELIMLGNKWQFSDNNNIVIGKKYIDIDGFFLTDQEKKIIIKDINNEGVEVILDNVDLAMANPFINYDKMDFGGEIDLSFKVFKMYTPAPVVTGNVFVQDFMINDEDFGTLEVDLSKTNNNPYEGLLSLTSSDHSLKSKVIYDPIVKDLDATLKAKNIPLRIFEFIIGDGVSEIAGGIDGDVTIAGPLDNLDLKGDAMLNNGAVKVDYLGAKFFFDEQPVAISKYMLDFTDDILTDSEGNVGIITGGIRHELFREFNMDLNISADNSIVLDTEKADNPLYYGYAQGKISVDFDGPFDRANLKVDAVTGPNTVLNLPVTYYQEGYDESFIKFVDRNNLDNQEITIINSNDNYKIKGLNIEMNITLNQDAQMRIIFDEARRDILEGRGNGNVQMNIDRYGAFDVFGEYEVVSGDYLFTVGPLVRKPFKIKPGGLIRWQGDPLDASLNIQAEYSVRTPLSIFLAEYLIDGTGVKQEAANSQVTVLELDLGGTIFQPKVNFGISFPQLNGELKTYADSKLRTLSTNEIALNSQVMGLIVSNSFLPTTGGIGTVGTNDFIESAGVNTLSELLSNQLSNLLTGLLTEALSDNGLISGIDFKVALRNNSGLLAESASALEFNEVEVNIGNRFAFLNERLSLNVGGNFIRNDQLQGFAGNYVAGNLILEYFLTDERKLKLRLYGTSDIDFQEQERRGKYGFGIGYRTEFGTLSEFQDGLSDALKEVIEEGNQELKE